MAAKKPAKSTYVVRTDAVIASSKPHFYGEKVKLSEEEAKPLLREGKGVEGVMLPPRVEWLPRPLRRYLKPGPKRSPEPEPSGWRAVSTSVPSLPIIELQYDWRPTHWDTPAYRQDVPK